MSLLEHPQPDSTALPHVKRRDSLAWDSSSDTSREVQITRLEKPDASSSDADTSQEIQIALLERPGASSSDASTGRVQ